MLTSAPPSALPAIVTEEQQNLFLAITAGIDLPKLLTLLGREIERLGSFAGHSIHLLDESGENLVCEHIALPLDHRKMQPTLTKYKFPINLPDAINDCFFTGNIVLVDESNISNQSETTANRFRLWELSAVAIVPLQCADEIIGAIMLFRQQGNIALDELQPIGEMLTLFANQIRNANHFARLKEHESQFLTQQREQEGFRTFVSQINSLTSEDQVYTTISHEFLRRFAFDIATILMREDDQLVIKKCTDIHDRYGEVIAAWNRHAHDRHYQLDVDDGASASVFLRNCHLHFHDVMEVLHLPMSVKDREIMNILKTPRTFVCMPIRRDNQPIGVLWLWSLETPVALSDIDLHIIEQLCSFIATAIANAKLYSTVNQQNRQIEELNEKLQRQNEQLNQLAAKDRLTGLYNFGYFQEDLQRRLQVYARTEGKDPLSLVMLDIDHFKAFNDTWGHVAGNQALCTIAGYIRSLARQIDIACRYGGEEFVIVLPHCDLEGARGFAERLRAAIAAAPVVVEGEAVSMTISAGCAQHQAHETATHFIERVDKALYRAKASGRNCVVATE